MKTIGIIEETTSGITIDRQRERGRERNNEFIIMDKEDKVWKRIFSWKEQNNQAKQSNWGGQNTVIGENKMETESVFFRIKHF